jgi:hypothetical protein
MGEEKHRKVPRCQFGVRGTLPPARRRAGTNVTVRNISTLGCELNHAEGPSVGKNCEVYFDWQGTHMGLEARVVWKDAEGRMGLRFLSVDKESQKRLKELCATLRTPPLASLPQEAGAARPVPKSAKAREVAPPTAVSEAAPTPPLRLPSELRRPRLPRYMTELPAHLSNPVTGATSSVTLVNLSVSGGCLEGLGLPEAGQKCEFHAEWEGERVLLRGDVVWKRKEQVGVKFSSLDEGTDNLLRRICSHLRLEPLAGLPPE